MTAAAGWANIAVDDVSALADPLSHPKDRGTLGLPTLRVRVKIPRCRALLTNVICPGRLYDAGGISRRDLIWMHIATLSALATLVQLGIVC